VAPRFPRTFYGPYAYRDCTGREHCLSTHLRSGRRVVRQSRLGRSVATVFQEGWLTLFGINLGKAPNIPRGYRVWLPKLGRVLTTSEVYFDPSFMSWRSVGDQRIASVAPVVAGEDDTDEPPELSPAVAPTVAAPTTLEEPYDRATRATPPLQLDVHQRCSSSSPGRTTAPMGWPPSWAPRASPPSRLTTTRRTGGSLLTTCLTTSSTSSC
jgi:hypothetical protein